MFTFEKTISGSLHEISTSKKNLRHCNTESIESMLEAALVVEIPPELFIQLLDWRVKFNSCLPHNRVHLLRLFQSFLRDCNRILFERLLAQIDAHLVFVDAEHLHHFLFAYLQEFLHGLDAFSCHLREHNEAFDIVVFD